MTRIMIPAWQAKILRHFFRKEGPIVFPNGVLHLESEKGFFRGEVKIDRMLLEISRDSIRINLPDIALYSLVGEPLSHLIMLPATGNPDIDEGYERTIIETFEYVDGTNKLTIAGPEVPYDQTR